MAHFIKRLYTDFGYPEFFFNRIYTATGICFHVSVYDRERKPYSFNMKQANEKWAFVHPDNCPPWITKLENPLGKAILEYQELAK